MRLWLKPEGVEETIFRMHEGEMSKIGNVNIFLMYKWFIGQIM